MAYVATDEMREQALGHARGIAVEAIVAARAPPDDRQPEPARSEVDKAIRHPDRRAKAHRLRIRRAPRGPSAQKRLTGCVCE